jgi:hypothetical protein
MPRPSIEQQTMRRKLRLRPKNWRRACHLRRNSPACATELRAATPQEPYERSAAQAPVAAALQRESWSSFGQVAVAKDGKQRQGQSRRNGMARGHRKSWQPIAKPIAEIAPRRSPVRARLAPSPKGLQSRAFCFPQAGSRLGESAVGQVLVKWRTNALIAPRRSPVRVRLAPYGKGLHMRASRFPQHETHAEKLPRGQGLVNQM